MPSFTRVAHFFVQAQLDTGNNPNIEDYSALFAKDAKICMHKVKPWVLAFLRKSISPLGECNSCVSFGLMVSKEILTRLFFTNKHALQIYFLGPRLYLVSKFFLANSSVIKGKLK